MYQSSAFMFELKPEAAVAHLDKINRLQAIEQALETGANGMGALMICFREWFKENPGQTEHPHLGNLPSLAKEIDKKWDRGEYGNNFVAEIIRAKLSSAKDLSVASSSMSC